MIKIYVKKKDLIHIINASIFCICTFIDFQSRLSYLIICGCLQFNLSKTVLNIWSFHHLIAHMEMTDKLSQFILLPTPTPPQKKGNNKNKEIFL